MTNDQIVAQKELAVRLTCEVVKKLTVGDPQMLINIYTKAYEAIKTS